MDTVTAFTDTLSVENWIAMIAVIIAAISVSFNAANYLAGRRERKLRTYEATPTIKATINAKAYKAGWRSVQLHLVPASNTDKNFSYENWRIERMRLLRPRNAELARAENDDYASGVFYSDTPVRALEGKGEGRPQRFALEFFINFAVDDDRGQKAKFRVIYSHVNGRRRYTAQVWVTVPADAEPASPGDERTSR